VIVRDGERLRGGKGSVPQRFPRWFVADGSTSAEINAAKMANFEEHEQASFVRAGRDVPSMPTPRKVPATKTFTNYFGHTIHVGDEIRQPSPKRCRNTRGVRAGRGLKGSRATTAQSAAA
jgi:hypothetical protein